jgi:hypothetical protein
MHLFLWMDFVLFCLGAYFEFQFDSFWVFLSFLRCHALDKLYGHVELIYLGGLLMSIFISFYALMINPAEKVWENFL